MRRAAKVDATQGAIIKALRENGMSAKDCSSVGQGFPDVVAGFRGGNYLLECKTRRDDCNRTDVGPLTEAQQKFHASWGGDIGVVSTPEEAVQWVVDTARAEGRL